MFKAIFACLLMFGSAYSNNIIETENMKDLPSLVDAQTVVFLNLDDTLNDSTITLGSGAWRQYIRKKIPEYEKQKGSRWSDLNLHDALTFYVSSNIPFKAVQPETPGIIKELQDKNIPVFVLTGRGKDLWYSTDIKGVDTLAFRQLERSGYDFNKGIPSSFDKIDPQYYAKGVFFSAGEDKGEFLEKEVFRPANFYPKKVVFVDDKHEGLESVQKLMKKLGVRDFQGVHYTRAKKEHKDFDPIVATIQLQELLNNGKVLSDKEALEIKAKMQVTDPDEFFFKFLDTVDVDQLKRTIPKD